MTTTVPAEPEAMAAADAAATAADLSGFALTTPRQGSAATAAAFKRETHARLRSFREKHGLGCFVQLAALVGHGVDDITLGRMHSGEKFPIEIWRHVAAGLDKFEKSETEE